MKIVNETIELPPHPGIDWLAAIGETLAQRLGPGRHPLRFYLARVDDRASQSHHSQRSYRTAMAPGS